MISDDIEALKIQSEKIEKYLREKEELLWVRTSFEVPVQSTKVELNQEEMSRLGLNKTLVSLGISTGLIGMKISDVWEDNYAVPVYLAPENREKSVSDLENVPVSGLFGSSVPLRQIAKISPEWNENTISHRNGLRTLTVMADIKRGENINRVLNKIIKHIDTEIEPQFPQNMKYEYGGSKNKMISSFRHHARGGYRIYNYLFNSYFPFQETEISNNGNAFNHTLRLWCRFRSMGIAHRFQRLCSFRYCGVGRHYCA